MSHTPGPWTAHDDDGTGTLPCVLSATVNKGGNFYVAQCNTYADARLIAAAPALLAACELALPVLRDQHAALAPVMHGGICPDREAMFAVEGALAAAKGE